jgi:hypothetical protein
MAKINPKIVENLKEADKIENDKIYSLFDEMILSRCTGKRTRDTDLNRELVSSVWSWLINKKLSGLESALDRYEYYWSIWDKSLKEDFYKVFIKSFKENNFNQRLIISMAEVANWDADAITFRNLISKCGEFDSIRFDEIYENVDGKVVKVSEDRISFKDIQTPVGVYRNYGFEVWVYVHHSTGVKKVELREPDGYVNNVRYEITFGDKYVALEDYVGYVKKCHTLYDIISLKENQKTKDFIKIESFKLHAVDLPFTEYGSLLELYTGYLKYGSVDNYIKNCLENKMLI